MARQFKIYMGGLKYTRFEKIREFLTKEDFLVEVFIRV